MNHVFEKTSIAGIVIDNRILRSATYEGMADEEGHQKDELLTTYERLAKNKVGAIVTGYWVVQGNPLVSCVLNTNNAQQPNLSCRT